MIRQISAEETYKLRQEVLRPGRPLEECLFDGDLEARTIHLGFFVEELLVGIATFVPRANELFDNPFQYQLRGMAVLPGYQGKNIGNELLLRGEEFLKKNQPETLLWFNARVSAVKFYKKNRYQTIGKPFMIPNVCMHQVMFKYPTEL